MKTLLVARKSLVEVVREWQLLLLVVAIPIAFLAITAFGYSAPLLASHSIPVMGPDPHRAALMDELASQRYAGDRPIFEVAAATDLDAALLALEEQTATAMVTVADGLPINRVTLTGDALYARFYQAGTILESVLYNYADRLSGQPEVVRIEAQPLGQAGPRTEFDLYAPGMMVFALLLIAPQTAMLVARELRWNTLRRLRLAPLKAGQLLGGISLAQMAVAVVQVVLIFLTALALGFHNQGSLLLAIVIGLAISFSSIGLGLLVACFVENDSQAINVGSAVAMSIVFLSGAFYQLPPMTVFVLWGHQIDVFDVFPATHGFSALQQVLVYGAGLEEVAFRLAATVVLSLVYLAVGVAVFSRLQMRRHASR